MKVVAILALVFLAPQNLSAQSAEALQKELNAHASTVRTWSDDSLILDAVRAQNAKKVPLADIQREDTRWISGSNEALVKQMIAGPCADRIRELARKAGYGESFVMDNQGALVCASDRTSDYWQGDEAKWIRAFDSGKGATFIDRPRFDDSSKANLAQVSVPILDGGRAIGVITAGVILKEAAPHN